jgi:hypothetical protein
MANTDEVLNQADALMRRHRSFVARIPAGDIPQSLDSDAEADIPVLTEVIVAADAVASNLDALLAALQNEIENELSAWLADALPAAVASASQHIITELDAKTRHTLQPRLQSLIAAYRDKMAGEQPL